MNSIFATLIALAFVTVCAGDEQAAPPTTDDLGGPAVVLPQFEVVASRPWWYVKVPGGQVLSQASREDTVAFARRLLAEQVFFSELAPEISLPETYTAFTIILDSSSVNGNVRGIGGQFLQSEFVAVKSAGDTMIRVCSGYDVQGGNRRSREKTVSHAQRFYGEYRDKLLHRDRDMPEWYRHGLQTCVAQLPPESRWLHKSDYRLIYRIGPYSLEALGLIKSAPGPAPSFIPFDPFFSISYPDVAVIQTRSVLWDDQCRLFLHWGLLGGGKKQREAFHRFVAEACKRPVDEALFRSCFGFGYEEGQRRFQQFARREIKRGDRLGENVYMGDSWNPSLGFLLTHTLKQAIEGAIDVRTATRTEVVKILGETYLWAGLKGSDRLWVGGSLNMDQPRFNPLFSGVLQPTEYLSRILLDWETFSGMNLRQYADRGLVQKAKHLMYGLREEENGHDPELAASLGFIESAEENWGKAAALLQEAANAGVQRPLVYSELARLRLCEALQEPKGTDGCPSRAQIDPVRIMAKKALAIDPEIGSAYQVLAYAWGCSGGIPPAEDLAVMIGSARRFPDRTASAVETAALLERAGRLDEAAELARNAVAWEQAKPLQTKSKRKQAFISEMRRLANPTTGNR